MDKYRRFYGIGLFIIVAFVLIYGSINIVRPKFEENFSLVRKVKQKEDTFEAKRKEKAIVESKIKKIKDSVASSQKKVFSPAESDLGNDSLFFTLYNDVVEMFHSNSIKIKSIDYIHNPADDEFVKFGKDVYFVCDLNTEIVSNYVNLGKLIQDIYQYPYYIKINKIETKPYPKDKKILITNLSLRLYAHTEPKVEE